MSIKKEMLSKRNWAIYGITADTEKFGYKIPEVMKENGYNVIGINKKYKGQDILGIKVYGSLEEVTEEVDCIDVIVNPNISMLVVDEAIKKGIKNIWFQPHTFNEEVIEKVKKADINYVDDDCVYAILTGE
ncbi:CoA-binding protein [Peptoanaerobacter stomatis]